MRKTIMLLILTMILLLASGCAAGTVPETGIPSEVPEILDLRGEALTPEEYRQLQAQKPQARILWSVPLSGGAVSSDAAFLSTDTLSEADLELISCLPALEEIDLSGCREYLLISRLQQQYPDLAVRYSVRLAGQEYASDFQGDITVADPDLSELAGALAYLPGAQRCLLEGVLPEPQSIAALMEALPQITFVWDFDFFGVTVNSLTEQVDISGVPMDDTRLLEGLLPCFYNLKTVDMCGCGLSNEVMGDLNDRYEDTKFVWEVKVGFLTVRTDSIYFMPSKYGVTWMRPEQTVNLKYLTDLIALDLGHYTGVNDLTFLHYMPELKILSLNSGTFSDLTPIATCQKLEYLEMFLALPTDLWPLTSCTSLKNLNISYMPYGDPTPLHQMTWLDRLWLANCQLSAEEKTALQEALPNTVMVFVSSSSTDKGWRNSPNYYFVRDLTDMSYMTR